MKWSKRPGEERPTVGRYKSRSAVCRCGRAFRPCATGNHKNANYCSATCASLYLSLDAAKVKASA